MASENNSTPRPENTGPKRPRSREEANQPGKRAKGNHVCPICDEVIKEQTKNKKGDDCIYCEGSCEAWLHRKCAGLSQVNFSEHRQLGDKEAFFCLHCQLKAYKAELTALKSSVQSLSTMISQIEEKLTAQQQNPSEKDTEPQTVTQDHPVANMASAPPSDKKLNVVVYGIPESPPNTKRQERLQADIKNVLSALPATESSIDASAIKDCYRLGKYNSKLERPRPLLVKLLRSADASNILQNKSKLASSIYIKPDLTPEEKAIESLLLKERRSLIQKGFSRQHIKIRNQSLYVQNKLHASIRNSKLELSESQTESPNQDTTQIHDSSPENGLQRMISDPPTGHNNSQST